MEEKFDFELYKKFYREIFSYTKPNGNILYRMSFEKDGEGFTNEIVNKYPFYIIQKQYYPDGNIKKILNIIGKWTFIGETLIFDKEGNIVSRINEDKKFEKAKIKLDDILLFLQEKKVLNIKEGTLWYDKKYFRFSYEIIFSDQDEEIFWIVKINDAIPFNPKKHGYIGCDRPLFFYEYFYIDAMTGKVFTQEEFINRHKTPKTTTFHGKTYTEEEWKAFEQEQWEKYQANKNHKSFWDKLFG